MFLVDTDVVSALEKPENPALIARWSHLMKIVQHLMVENFRAINRVELTNLRDMIVGSRAGNGCGKSCVLDAVRLFKSVYGWILVSRDEWHQWMNEFQIRCSRLASNGVIA